MLVTVRIPNEREEGVRRLQRRRNKLTDLLRNNKQEIKSLILENHIEEPAGLDYWSKASVEALKLDFDTNMTLESLLREQDFILAERKFVDEAVEQCLTPEQKQKVVNLQSVPGVGAVLAKTYVTEIFQSVDISRFGPYCLLPWACANFETKRTKQGDWEHSPEWTTKIEKPALMDCV